MSKIIKYVRVQNSPIVISHAVMAPDIKSNLSVEAAAVINTDHEILSDAYQEAGEIISTARIEAENIVKQAEEQIADKFKVAQEQGYQAGYQEGYTEGLNKANKEISEVLQQAVSKAQKILSLADQEYRERVLASERQIVELALTVAQKILHREIADNPMVVLPIVRAALAKVQEQDQITILVNPDDYDLLLQAKRDLQMLIGRERALTIVADNTISPGGCMIDTPCGTVDAKLDTQLEMIRKSLQDVVP